MSITVFDNHWVKPGAVRLWSPGIAVSLTGLHGAFVMNPSVKKVRKRDPITVTIPCTDGKSHIQREGRVQWKSWQGFAVNSNSDIHLLNAKPLSFLIDTSDGKISGI